MFHCVLLLSLGSLLFCAERLGKGSPVETGDGEELGGMQGEEAVTGMYYMREEFIFN